jgi:hypothetical protein
MPAIGMTPRLLVVLRLPIPGVSMAKVLRLPIPIVNMATRLGRAESLAIHLRGMGTRLRPGEGLTIRLRGKRTIRSGLGAYGAQGHKQT